MTHFAKILASTALAAGMTVGAAAAATVSVLNSNPQGSGNGAGISFAVGYGANTPVDASWAAAPDTVVGNSYHVAQSPFNSNGLTGTNSYFSVDPINTTNNPAILTFNIAQTVFNILWGSVDSYNSITFSDGSTDWTYDGVDIALAAGIIDATQAAIDKTKDVRYEISALVNFSDFDNAFTSVSFNSTNVAFEYALAPVPLPAGGVLLVTALGGLVLARRRKSA